MTRFARRCVWTTLDGKPTQHRDVGVFQTAFRAVEIDDDAKRLEQLHNALVGELSHDNELSDLVKRWAPRPMQAAPTSDEVKVERKNLTKERDSIGKRIRDLTKLKDAGDKSVERELTTLQASLVDIKARIDQLDKPTNAAASSTSATSSTKATNSHYQPSINALAIIASDSKTVSRFVVAINILRRRKASSHTVVDVSEHDVRQCADLHALVALVTCDGVALDKNDWSSIVQHWSSASDESKFVDAMNALFPSVSKSVWTAVACVRLDWYNHLTAKTNAAKHFDGALLRNNVVGMQIDNN